MWIEHQGQDANEEEISTLDETFKASKTQIAWAKTSKINDSFTAFYKALYSTEKQENRGFVSTNEDFEESFLKATIGFEVMLKDLLITNEPFNVGDLAGIREMVHQLKSLQGCLRDARNKLSTNLVLRISSLLVEPHFHPQLAKPQP